MSNYGIIEREVIVLLLCFIILAALQLTTDHVTQAWQDLFMEIFANRLTTILRLLTYMRSDYSIP